MTYPKSMALYGSYPMLKTCLPQWEAAMGSCFHFELMVRLLAQKFFAGESVTRDIADGKKGEGLLSLLFGHLTFSSEERVFLPKCNTLRNKLIHCEPDGALRIVQELVPSFIPRRVAQRVALPPNATGADILKMLQTGQGAIDVLETTSRSEGFIGWMLQSANDGTFGHASALLARGMAIIDSKAM